MIYVSPIYVADGFVRFILQYCTRTGIDKRIPLFAVLATDVHNALARALFPRLPRLPFPVRLSGLCLLSFEIGMRQYPVRSTAPAILQRPTNGLLLCPNADFLFARGLVGFDEIGDFITTPAVSENLLLQLHLDPVTHRNVGQFTRRQAEFLAFHRDRVLLRAAS